MISTFEKWGINPAEALWALWLRTKDDVYTLLSWISKDSVMFRGILVVNEEIASAVSDLECLPLYDPIDDTVVKIEVDGDSLVWKPEIEDELVEVFGEEAFGLSALMHEVIQANVSAVLVKLAKNEAQLKARLRIYAEKIKKIQAAVIQDIGAEIRFRYKALTLKGRHITTSVSDRFLVPDKIIDLLGRPMTLRHIVIVDGDTAYTVEKVSNLDKFSINVNNVVFVGKQRIKEMVCCFNRASDTLLGLVIRHPVIGYIGAGTFEIADINGIGVPKHIADKLDGDDDGDIIEVLPLVIVKNRKVMMTTTTLDA